LMHSPIQIPAPSITWEMELIKVISKWKTFSRKGGYCEIAQFFRNIRLISKKGEISIKVPDDDMWFNFAMVEFRSNSSILAHRHPLQTIYRIMKSADLH
jgi:hypothetical protein